MLLKICVNLTNKLQIFPSNLLNIINNLKMRKLFLMFLILNILHLFSSQILKINEKKITSDIEISLELLNEQQVDKNILENVDMNNLFLNYCKKYSKSYCNVIETNISDIENSSTLKGLYFEYYFRKSIFEKNVREILKHNNQFSNKSYSSTSLYKIGISEFTDMTLEELKTKYLSEPSIPINKVDLKYLKENDLITDNEEIDLINNNSELEPIDWRSKDIFFASKKSKRLRSLLGICFCRCYRSF